MKASTGRHGLDSYGVSLQAELSWLYPTYFENCHLEVKEPRFRNCYGRNRVRRSDRLQPSLTVASTTNNTFIITRYLKVRSSPTFPEV